MKPIWILAAVFAMPGAAGAAPLTPGDIEILQANASISFHARQYSQAAGILKKILASEPENVNALELLALAQRQTKDDNGATQTYTKLIAVGATGNKPAYHFELASIRYKQKKAEEARTHFGEAAKANFNPGTSHFYLGIMEFDAKNWAKARHHLSASMTYSDAEPMRAVTRYYLANTLAQLGKSEAALRSYNAVEKDAQRAQARANDISSMTAEVRKNALKELQNLDKEQRAISLTMQSQWDSNVQTNPSEVSNPTAQSSQRSLKTTFSAYGSYSTSPMKPVQFAPSYSFSTNYNFNDLARDYNFITHAPQVYALYKQYERLNAGVKVAGTYTMKNNLSATDSRGALKYRSYSLTGDLGPVAKYDLTPRVALAAEVTWRPKKFYLDPTDGDTRRSGGGLFAKLSSELVSESQWIAPLVYVSYEWDHTAGKDYRMTAWGAGISNPVQYNDKLTLSPTLDVVSYDYNETSNPARDDFYLAARVAASYMIDANWSGVGDLGYTINESTNSTSFKYNRFVVSAGASYVF